MYNFSFSFHLIESSIQDSERERLSRESAEAERRIQGAFLSTSFVR